MDLPGEQKLEFTLLSSNRTEADLDCTTHNSFVFHWPLVEVNEWMRNDETVGMYATLTNTIGQPLSIAIEKDFACKPSDQESFPDRYFARPNQERAC
jgi:hypothetical protein